MSEKWIDQGPESELIVPEDIKTSVDAQSTDDTVPSAKCLATMAGDVEEALRIIRDGRVGGWIYGYVIDESDPNPSTRVSYIEDNKNYSPLYMDFANDSLVWGSWKSFVEEYFKPAMLTSAGVIDYYLYPDDLTKKADGVTASDVANTSYDGNAMLIVKPIYYNISRISGSKIAVRFSNIKQGIDWLNWTHLKSDGTIADFCGWPLFTGTIISSRLRSISTGAAANNSRSFGDNYSCATSNGSNWYPTTWADEMLIRLLFPLLCKSTDSKAAIGGSGSVGSESAVKCGYLLTRGYFYGRNDYSSLNPVGSKFLGMEDVWGNRCRWCYGCEFVTSNGLGRMFIKLTPSMADGSKTTSFITSSSESDYRNGYIATPLAYPKESTNGAIIQGLDASATTAMLCSIVGSDAGYDTYYAAGAWFGSSVPVPVALGGANGDGIKAGIFTQSLGISPSTQQWWVGASLSYHFF